MRRALLELLLLGVAGSLVGCWVLLYKLAYSTESLAHALFPGLVAAALLGFPLLAGGAVLALSPSSPPGLESLLFGDLLGVTRGDLVISGVLVAATGAAVVSLHRP